MLDALRRSSLHCAASLPNIGCSRRAQSATSRSQSLIWKTAAPARGTQTYGSFAALTAEARMRSQPGVSVALAPKGEPLDIVAQPLAPNSASAAHRSHSPMRKRDIRDAFGSLQARTRLRASSVAFRYSCVHLALRGSAEINPHPSLLE